MADRGSMESERVVPIRGEAADPLVGAELRGDGGLIFALRERIARGVLATVYRAEITSGPGAAPLGGAAVKLLDGLPGDSADLRARFVREIGIARRLDERSAPRCLDEGTIARGAGAGRPFYAVELLPGRTLAARIRDRGEAPLAEALDVGIAILEALAPVHEAGIVHRDLKPANVMLVAEAPRARARLLDFGAARLGASPDPRGEALGTPAYASPEAIAGLRSDGRADLYALGVILFELCCGRRPFVGDPVAVLRAHLEERAPDPSGMTAPLPATVAAAIRRALEKEPGRRFPDAATMRAALLALREERA